VDSLIIESLDKWGALTVEEKAKILKRHMPEKVWTRLRESMATMSTKDMTPIQIDAVVYLMGPK
jgi:hypothetical protein